MDTRKRETYIADISITLFKPPTERQGSSVYCRNVCLCPQHSQWEASVTRGSEFPDSGELDL